MLHRLSTFELNERDARHRQQGRAELQPRVDELEAALRDLVVADIELTLAVDAFRARSQEMPANDDDVPALKAAVARKKAATTSAKSILEREKPNDS